jgi:hypothetical protein
MTGKPFDEYPLVNSYGKSLFFMGKSLHKWPFSIAMLNYQRVSKFIAASTEAFCQLRSAVLGDQIPL